jgi:aspartate racemase
MRRIGLIGGMSFEGTALYYRHINEAVRARLKGYSSADIVMHSVNFQPIVEMQRSGRWDEAGQHLARVARGLESAGAECVLMCAVTMHLIAPTIEQAIGVPFLLIVDATARRLKAAGLRRPLLLATRYTMEHTFYSARMAEHGIEIMVPDANGRARAHDIIVDELGMGTVLDRSRVALMALVEEARRQGADSVILGCTEICLILDPDNLPLPGFDSTAIHADAAVKFALS